MATKGSDGKTCQQPQSNVSVLATHEATVEQPKKRFKSNLSDTVDIVAGAGDHECGPMKLYLCKAHEIPFFSKCLSHGFKENEENTVRLPEDEPLVVEAFLKLLVFGSGASQRSLWDAIAETICGEDFARCDVFLTRLWILADKLGAEYQQNQLKDLLRAYYYHRYVHPDCFKVLKEAQHEESKLFQLLIRQMAFDFDTQEWEDLEKLNPGVSEWVEGGGFAVKELMKSVSGTCVDHSLRPFYDEDIDTLERRDDLCDWHHHVLSPTCSWPTIEPTSPTE